MMRRGCGGGQCLAEKPTRCTVYGVWLFGTGCLQVSKKPKLQKSELTDVRRDNGGGTYAYLQIALMI